METPCKSVEEAFQSKVPNVLQEPTDNSNISKGEKEVDTYGIIEI